MSVRRAEANVGAESWELRWERWRQYCLGVYVLSSWSCRLTALGNLIEAKGNLIEAKGNKSIYFLKYVSMPPNYRYM